MSSAIILQEAFKTPVHPNKQRGLLHFMSPISDKGHNYTLHINLISDMQIQIPSLNRRCTLNSLATLCLLFLQVMSDLVPAIIPMQKMGELCHRPSLLPWNAVNEPALSMEL